MPSARLNASDATAGELRAALCADHLAGSPTAVALAQTKKAASSGAVAPVFHAPGGRGDPYRLLDRADRGDRVKRFLGDRRFGSFPPQTDEIAR
jgi:hypothetical protein